MEKEQIISWLTNLCQGKDWFHSVGFDKYGRAVVYVRYMDSVVMRFVPDWTEGGQQVLCHFAASATSNASDFYANQTSTQPLPTLTNGTSESVVAQSPLELTQLAEEEERQLELSVRALTDELDKLERMCGSNILQDIFYEIHDKDNAVTNLSAKFPEVSQRMEKLHAKYGFDIIYDELDG
jgi:hypothetical protein